MNAVALLAILAGAVLLAALLLESTWLVASAPTARDEWLTRPGTEQDGMLQRSRRAMLLRSAAGAGALVLIRAGSLCSAAPRQLRL